MKAAVPECRANAVGCLADRSRKRADERNGRKALFDICLTSNKDTFGANQGCAVNFL